MHIRLVEDAVPRRFVDAAVAAGLIDAIGSTDPETLAKCILEAVAPALGACECSVFAHEGSRGPRLLSAAAEVGPWDAFRRAAIHAREFAALDELRSLIERKPAAGAVGAVFVCRQRAEDMPCGALRTQVLQEAGLVDRLSLLVRFGEGVWLAAHLYRGEARGSYGADDLESGAGIARLVARCMARHYHSDPGGVAALRGSVSDGLVEIGAQLTEREREVLTRILDGVTVNRIAEDLKLRPTTIATYRLRAYEKLGVTSRQELFAAILGRRASGRRLPLAA